MIKMLSRRTFRARYPQAPRADHYHEQYFFPPVKKSWVLEVPSAPNYKLLYGRMAKAFGSLMEAMGELQLQFFTDSSAPFLQRDIDNLFNKNSRAYFHRLGVQDGFNGALDVPVADFPAFIPHLMLMTRTNGVLPDVYFINVDQTFTGLLCKYGNLHLYALTPAAEGRLSAAFESAGLRVAQDCFPSFSSRLPGRRTPVS